MPSTASFNPGVATMEAVAPAACPSPARPKTPQPVALGNGEQRTFLEDGDAIALKACSEKPGAVRVGFGVRTGTALPARA